MWYYKKLSAWEEIMWIVTLMIAIGGISEINHFIVWLMIPVWYGY
jgi:hypothetical protein